MEFTRQIVTKDGSKVLAFQGGWCSLSNARRSPFTKFGVRYLSVHQYILSRMASEFGDHEACIAIMHARTVKEQSQAASVIKGFNAEKWAKVVDGYMSGALNEKFIWHPHIFQELKASGDSIIASCSRYDRVWSTGLDIDDPDMEDMAKWGENRLGKLLMEFRRDGYDIPN